VWLGGGGRWQPVRLPVWLPSNPRKPAGMQRPCRPSHGRGPWISYCSGTSIRQALIRSTDGRPSEWPRLLSSSGSHTTFWLIPWIGRAAPVVAFMARAVPVPGCRRPAVLCDHEGALRGTASRGRRAIGCGSACHVAATGAPGTVRTVSAGLERALADPAITPAGIASEPQGRGLRPGDGGAGRRGTPTWSAR
jgi:hypothetical protein